MNIEILNRWIANLRQRVLLMIGKAVILTVDDSKAVQLVKAGLFEDEEIDKYERLQNFGFTSVPPENSQAIIAFLAGNRDAGVILAADDSSNRPNNLQPGDSIHYGSSGSKVKIGSGGDIEIESSGGAVVKILENGNVEIDATDCKITTSGTLDVNNGNLTVS